MTIVFVVARAVRKEISTGRVVRSTFMNRPTRYSVELSSLHLPMRYELGDGMVIVANSHPTSVLDNKAVINGCQLIEFI